MLEDGYYITNCVVKDYVVVVLKIYFFLPNNNFNLIQMLKGNVQTNLLKIYWYIIANQSILLLSKIALHFFMAFDLATNTPLEVLL